MTDNSQKPTKYRATSIRAACGNTLTAKSWLTEAPLRMLMNNLDPEVAENPKELVVYGGIVDEQATSLNDALAHLEKYTKEGKAISIALLGNAAKTFPELVKRGVRLDMVTDQTSAHDPLNGYLPAGWTWDEYRARAKSEPAAVVGRFGQEP